MLTLEFPIGKAQLATELTLSPEGFNQYHIADVPASIAFQLREFTVGLFLLLVLVPSMSLLIWNAGDCYIRRFDEPSHLDALHETRPSYCHRS